MTSGEPGLTPAAMSIAREIARSGALVGVAARDVIALESATGVAAVAAGAAEVAALGGQAILLGSVRQASPQLDPGELRDAAAAAAAHGIELHANIGALHERRFRSDLVEETLAAADDLGIAQLHVIFGLMEDRFADDPPWTQSLRSAVAPTRRLVERAGRPLVMRTHEEMTTFEAARFVDEVDHPGLRIAYSPVNVVCRVEDPLDAYDRVDSHTTTLFLDDGELVRVPAGADRRLRPLGEGTVDWLTVFRRFGRREGAVVFLDLAQAVFDVPFLDPAWLVHQPELTPVEFARFVRATRADGPPQSPLERRRAVAREVLRRAAGEASAPPADEPGQEWTGWLSTLDDAGFREQLSEVFEHSPWVAEGVGARRPYTTLDELHGAMMSLVAALPEDEVDAFLRLHPELGAGDRETLTAASVQEQSGAGLLRLTGELATRARRLNADYRARNGFPLIIAVGGMAPDEVIAEMELRQAGDRAAERGRALEAIGRITRMRLERLARAWRHRPPA